MTPSPPKERESALPLVGMIFSGVGLVIPPLLLVGLVIGVIALVQKKGSPVLAVLAVLVPLVAVTIFGILFAIALPKYRAEVARTAAARKQGECRANLKSGYVAERSYFEEYAKYDEHPAKVGFVPERGNRYLYLLAPSGPVSEHIADPGVADVGIGVDPTRGSNAEVFAALPQALRDQVGVKGICPDCSITILCAGNLDDDPALDVWTISTAARPGILGGEVHLELSDLNL